MIRRLTAQLRTPLLRNGYSLAVNTVAAAGLGTVYWIIAARLYSTEDVGVNAALISAMIFLAKLAQLNLVNALNRFVPQAGRSTRRLIASWRLGVLVLTLLLLLLLLLLLFLLLSLSN